MNNILAEFICKDVILAAETTIQAIPLIDTWLAVGWTTRRYSTDNDSRTFRPRSTDAVYCEATISSSVI